MNRCGGRDRPGCGAEIVWGVLPDGRKVPLDLTYPVYKMLSFDPNINAYAIERVSGHKASHVHICPLSKPNNQGATRSGAARTGGRDRAVKN